MSSAGLKNISPPANDKDVTDGAVSSGKLGSYYKRVTQPAAKAIHASGGKVVFGGWPTAPGFALTKKYGKQSFISWLDYHNAWGDIDVLDFHYRNRGIVNAFQRLLDAAKERGFGDKGNIKLKFKNLSKHQIKSASRVTPYGQRNNLMFATAPSPGAGIELTVDTEHISLPFNDKRKYLKSSKSYARTIFVVLELPTGL